MIPTYTADDAAAIQGLEPRRNRKNNRTVTFENVQQYQQTIPLYSSVTSGEKTANGNIGRNGYLNGNLNGNLINIPIGGPMEQRPRSQRSRAMRRSAYASSLSNSSASSASSVSTIGSLSVDQQPSAPVNSFGFVHSGDPPPSKNPKHRSITGQYFVRYATENPNYPSRARKTNPAPVYGHPMHPVGPTTPNVGTTTTRTAYSYTTTQTYPMNPIQGMNGMNGMNGMVGINGMAGMPPMTGMNGMGGVNAMNGMNGYNGAHSYGLNGMNGMNGMGGINGINGMGGGSAMYGTNGYNPNGYAPNGYAANGYAPNGYTPSGSINGSALNGYTPNGHAVNGLNGDASTASTVYPPIPSNHSNGYITYYPKDTPRRKPRNRLPIFSSSVSDAGDSGYTPKSAIEAAQSTPKPVAVKIPKGDTGTPKSPGEGKQQFGLCPKFGSAMGCRWGRNCFYKHSDPNSVEFCPDFYKEKGCSFGNKCFFRHQTFVFVKRGDPIPGFIPKKKLKGNKK